MTRVKRYRRLRERRCRVCGARYLPRVWHQLTCSPVCSERLRHVRRLGRYGGTHRQLREAVRSAVEAGGAACVRCGAPIRPGEPWDLDHAQDGVTYRGPAHARCNRATLLPRGKEVSPDGLRVPQGGYTSRAW